MRIDLPDEHGSNVISIEVARNARHRKGCKHKSVTIDPTLATVECRDCGEKLNPVEWMAMLVEDWGRVKALYDRYNAAKAELDKRSRFKCKHCGMVTPVNLKATW